MKRDIIVVGASAGGIQALEGLVSGLDPRIPAAVFVVLHIPPWIPSSLAQILQRAGSLPAHDARSNQPIEHGRIYVAPPDYHLLLEQQMMTLWRGPKENRNRPAVNTLFRSAAVNYGERVTGVVLSGALDDGSAGLWWIRNYGGAALVQDPAEAQVPAMPCSALECVRDAKVLSVEKMGEVLTRLANGEQLIDSDPEETQWKQKRA